MPRTSTHRRRAPAKTQCRVPGPETHQGALRIKMNSEDCSITENSSLHLEKGQKNNATSSCFEVHHEGSLQVPIPCAVLNVVLITILIIALIALSVGQYNCPGQPVSSVSSVSSDTHISSCSEEWVVYQGKCYFLSTTTKSWTSAKNSCSKKGATLAVIDSEKDMIFLKRYAGRTEHWIGLKNEANQTWKWSNGKEFKDWFNLTGSEKCAFLNGTDVSSTECEKNLHWICSKPSKQ